MNLSWFLFGSKLVARGYTMYDIMNIFLECPWSPKQRTLSRKLNDVDQLVRPLKLFYSSAISKICIGSALHEFSHLLPVSFKDRYQLAVCCKSHPNNFQRAPDWGFKDWGFGKAIPKSPPADTTRKITRPPGALQPP